jgi:ribonuclease VapC
MIFVDASAMVAILAADPEAASLAAKLDAEQERISAGHVILEASVRLAGLLGFAPGVAGALVASLIREADISIVPITEEIAHVSVNSFERYGRGRGAVASLNLGDCLTYACAKVHNARLLSKGSDFAQTDLGRA